MSKARTNADNVTADIAGITAGTGITGGGTSGTVTITNSMATAIDAAGDLIYGTGSDAFTRLGLGTASQQLRVNSGATAPEWFTPVSGSTFSGARVTKSANQTLTSGTWTIVSFNTEQFDVDGYHNNVTNNSRLTIPSGKSGYFLLYGKVDFGANSNGVRQINIVKNGTDILNFDDAATSGTYTASRQISLIVNAVATDYFELNCRQDSGGNRDIFGGSEAANFCITYLGA